MFAIPTKYVGDTTGVCREDGSISKGLWHFPKRSFLNSFPKPDIGALAANSHFVPHSCRLRPPNDALWINVRFQEAAVQRPMMRSASALGPSFIFGYRDARVGSCHRCKPFNNSS
jgi:hypothetical protein